MSGQSKSRPVKAAGAEVSAQRRNQKLHAAVAKSTFESQNVQNMTASEHFCLFRCRKIARRCGEKHIRKSKCTKHDGFGALLSVQMSKNCTPLWRKAHLKVKMCMFGPLLSVQMSKNCTPLWRKAHLKVKMYKTPHVWTTFVCLDVAKLHAAVAKCTFESQNVKKL